MSNSSPTAVRPRRKRKPTAKAPAPAAELTGYTVKSRIDHDGKTYLPGDSISLGQIAAAAVKRAGAV